MSDIDEGVGWRIKADMSDVLAAYDKAEAASKKATDTAVAGALKAGDAMAKAGASAQKTGEAWNKAAESGAKGFTSATGAVDKFIARVNESQTKLQALQTRFAAMQGTFGQGQGMTAGGFAGSILQAGSLKNFAALSGGPLGVAALTAGFAAGQLEQFAAIGDLADKAKASAQEVDGLQRVLSRLGMDAGTSGNLLGTFADKLNDARQHGGELKQELDDLGISLTNADGSSRSAIAVLGDLAERIKTTSDNGEKLRLATLAVGDQLAGPFLQAVNQSKTGLSDLAAASKAAGSAFMDDLARGAQAAMKAIKDLGDRADNAYAKIKRYLGVASETDQVKAAKADLTEAEGELKRQRYGQKIFGTSAQGSVDAAALDLERKRFALQDLDGTREQGEALRRAMLKSAAGTYGPQPKSDDDDDDEKPLTVRGRAGRGGGGGGSSAKAEEVDRAQQVIDRLREQLAATKDLDTANGSIVEKQRTVAELLRAGVTLESEQGQQIAGLVSQIDAVKRAEQSRVEALQQVRTLTADVAGGIDQWLVGGQKFGTAMQGVLKQMESQMLRMALIGGNGKGGLFGSLLSGFGGGGEGGGFLEKIAGFFAGKFADGGEIPAGKFGLVGEAGPELVTGPRQITPMHRLASGGAPVINNVWNVAGVTSRAEVMGWIKDGMAATHRQTLAAVPGYMRDQQDRGF